jgi:hypothetical protein
MIPPDVHKHAMAAVEAVLVVARDLAEESRAADVGEALEVAEYLSVLMLEPGDRTAEFRQQLIDLATKLPQFALALEKFPLPIATS